MQLEHEFTVPVPVDRAWKVLIDVETIAPCMPGATLDTVDGDAFTGQVKVKVGPITVSYAGQASFLEKDPVAHRAVVEAKGRETRGSGTAVATVTASMADEGTSTRVNVVTDLAITGKPAQFGRGVMNDVGNKLLGQFADCLADRLTAGRSATAESAEGTVGPAPAGVTAESASAEGSNEPAGAGESRPTPEAIDLLGVAGGSVLKRVAPVVAAVALLLLLWRLVRRRR